jgi:hypothetical protein
MPDLRLTRRASLLLPFVLAACGGGEPETFAPLRYNYLPPIRLNVGGIQVQQRYYPSGEPPDITSLDPAHPVEALMAMAQDRLQAVGTSGEAVFAITNAALTKQGDVITCALAVELEIYPTPGVRSGFAEALASRQHIGSVDDMAQTLYDLTKTTMNAMNVEFEYQVRRNLQPWLVVTEAPPSVQQQPLSTGPAEQPQGLPAAPSNSPAPMAPAGAPGAPPPSPGTPPLAVPGR